MTESIFENVVSGHVFIEDDDHKQDLFYNYGIKPLAPHIKLKDGITMSVQASEFHYCTPRNNKGPYTHVEVGFISQDPFPEDMWIKYAEDGTIDSDVFVRVPVEVVRHFIKHSGGEV